MSDSATKRFRHEPSQYEIIVVGELQRSPAEVFEAMSFTTGKGSTVITGWIADQAQLRGILDWLGDMGVDIVSVNRVGA